MFSISSDGGGSYADDGYLDEVVQHLKQKENQVVVGWIWDQEPWDGESKIRPSKNVFILKQEEEKTKEGTYQGVEKASTKWRILQAAVIDIDWNNKSLKWSLWWYW